MNQTCKNLPEVPSVSYLCVLRALGVVGGMKHLQAAHVTHIAMEIGTIDPIATFSNGGVRTELLPELLVLHR